MKLHPYVPLHIIEANKNNIEMKRMSTQQEIIRPFKSFRFYGNCEIIQIKF